MSEWRAIDLYCVNCGQQLEVKPDVKVFGSGIAISGYEPMLVRHVDHTTRCPSLYQSAKAYTDCGLYKKWKKEVNRKNGNQIHQNDRL